MVGFAFRCSYFCYIFLFFARETSLSSGNELGLNILGVIVWYCVSVSVTTLDITLAIISCTAHHTFFLFHKFTLRTFAVCWLLLWVSFSLQFHSRSLYRPFNISIFLYFYFFQSLHPSLLLSLSLFSYFFALSILQKKCNKYS